MRNGIVLQVQGLGVPVQVPSTRVEAGFEVRWSSDPESSPDAPAHVLHGHHEVQRFLALAVDPRFLQGDMIKIIPVEVDDDQSTLSKAACVTLGVSPDNWSNVRVALVVTGNTSRGPVMDTLEWLGSRDEYAAGAPMREALQHAHARGMRSPSFFTQQEGGHILRAAEFMQNFRRQMKPSLRLAELMQEKIVQSIIQSDFSDIHPERATHYLRQAQEAMRNCQEQRLNELEDLGLEDALLLKTAQDARDSLAADQYEQSAPSPRRSGGPMLH